MTISERCAEASMWRFIIGMVLTAAVVVGGLVTAPLEPAAPIRQKITLSR